MSKVMRDWHRQIEERDDYWVQKAKTFVALDLQRLFIESGRSKSEWASHIGKSKAYISKLFNHDVNFTLDTMVRLARSLNGRLEVRIVPEASESQLVPAWGETSHVEVSMQPDPVRNVIMFPANIRSISRSNDESYADAA